MSETGFEHHYAHLDGVTLHFVTAGAADAEPLVLLHGWPQTWYEWRHVMPELARRWRVIAPDLRGLGDSSRPPGGYDKRTVAADIWQLLCRLGVEKFSLVGHDWGGPVAYRLAADHPDAVRRLAILDVVIPGDGTDVMYMNRWHHGFHWVPDVPEALTAGRERIYLEHFYRNWGARPDVMTEADIDEYVRTFAKPGAMRAGFNLYRATPQDVADNRETIARFRLPMPVLGLSGSGGRGRGADVVLASLGRVADDVRGEELPDCGHWVAEEVPDLLVQKLFDFFGTGA